MSTELSGTPPAVLALSGARRGEKHEIVGELVIGRATECSIAIADPNLSRHHARFVCDAAALVVEDLGSRNGTFVNGKRVARTTLSDGDIVTIGGSEFRVQIAGAAP